MIDQPPTRYEFTELARRVTDNDAMLRSTIPLAVQVAEVIKDVADLKREVEQRLDVHERQHEKEAAQRSSNRRWAVATVVAAIAAIDGPLAAILLSRR